MPTRRVLLDDLKAYALEVYAPGGDHLIWRHDSDQPFSPMACGDGLVVPEAEGAASDLPWRIAEVEHVIYTARAGDVRFVTRVTVRH